jgi:hypothetical protein
MGPLDAGRADAPAIPGGGGTPAGEGIGSIIGDTFAGLDGALPARDAAPASGGIGSAVSGALAGFGGNPLPGLGAGLLDVGSQALHGIESFAREIPGLGGLIPGADGAAPAHAKHPKQAAHGASRHGAAQHAAAHPQRGAGSHAGAAHHPAKHGSGHPSASHHAAKGAKPGGPGMLESMHQKARLMQFEAGALDTAATVGTGISNFAHEIPFVNELL